MLARQIRFCRWCAGCRTCARCGPCSYFSNVEGKASFVVAVVVADQLATSVPFNAEPSEHGFSGCEFSNEKRPGVRFRFDIPVDECKLIIYHGGEGVRFYIDYLSFKVVYSGSKKGVPIYFYMERVSTDGFNADRHLIGKKPIAVRDGIEVYELGGYEERKFNGKDDVPVYSSDYLAIIRASRLYKSEMLVFYQYPKNLVDVKSMDSFALDVLSKMVAE